MRKVDPEKHAEKRREILMAAGRCFARSGFRGASISDICAEAGVSPGHLYHYFPSKEAIIEMMAELGLEESVRRYEAMMGRPDVIAALLALFDEFRLKQGARSALAAEMLAEAGRNPAIAKIVRERNRTRQELLVGFLRRGQEVGQIDPKIDATIAATIIFSIMDVASSIQMSNPALASAAGWTSSNCSSRAILRPPHRCRSRLRGPAARRGAQHRSRAELLIRTIGVFFSSHSSSRMRRACCTPARGAHLRPPGRSHSTAGCGNPDDPWQGAALNLATMIL